MDAVGAAGEISPLPILVINSGSSSIKFSVYQAAGREKTLLFDGAVDGIRTANGSFHVKGSDGQTIVDEKPQIADVDAGFKLIGEALKNPPFPKPGAIGHRLVAGGPHLRENQRVTPEVIAELEKYAGFAPLHNPPAISIVRRMEELFPAVPNFVCFDSAFHTTISEAPARFAIPERYWDAGIRRYGAHGLSCESILYQLGENLPPRLIVAHLGNGCSVTAIRDGRSVDTSMGLTPTGGIISGTRTGDLDPGVLLYMLRDFRAEEGKPALSREEAADRLEHLVNKDSGLLGASAGISDMRDLRVAVGKGNRLAVLAAEQFVYELRKFIGGYFAVLGGLDMLVFTGGIGEHDAATRGEVCGGLGSLGIVLDAHRNENLHKGPGGQAAIHGVQSAVKVMVVPAQEDLIIANHVYSLVRE